MSATLAFYGFLALGCANRAARFSPIDPSAFWAPVEREREREFEFEFKLKLKLNRPGKHRGSFRFDRPRWRVDAEPASAFDARFVARFVSRNECRVHGT